ncbi:MAG: hypothetical protein M3O20_15140 [Acidobacteriota bacterium]|nr:hypothetical protein [Acidobacteriota bacterium]
MESTDTTLRLTVVNDRNPREIIDAALTTDHAASSYGQPVLIVDGEAYGPADWTRTLGTDGVIPTAAQQAMVDRWNAACLRLDWMA